MNYIGIDVSKQDISVFDGKLKLEFENKRGMKKLRTYLKKKFKNFDNIVIIFESTGTYSDYIKEFCSIHKIKACIVNPKKSSNFAKAIGNRSKTDKIDAEMLYNFKNIIQPKDISVPEIDKISDELSSYLASYEFALKKVISISNHIEALTHKANAPKKLLSMWRKELKTAKKIQNNIIQEMEDYIEQNSELCEKYHKLLTIPGVGKISAMSLLSVLKKYKNTNRSQIIALVGLDPVRRESGTSIKGRMKISKSGNKILRKILYFPILNAIRYNKKIKQFYDRLLENHKPKKIAIIAAMRKLILIAHAMYKNDTVFCEEL